MAKIIVSYRRSDSQAVAGRIVDRLIEHFGADAVFMDVDNIPFGVDFRDHIQSVLGSAAVLIAIVGPDWLGGEAGTHRRIDDEDDPVRVELETALRQKLLVIPVLVNNATMPKANVLPDALRGFSFLNAAPVDSGRDFRPHVDRLIQSIEKLLAPKGAATGRLAANIVLPPASAPAPPAASGGNPKLVPIAAAAVALAVAIGGGAWWLGESSGKRVPATSVAPPAPTGIVAQAPPAAPAVAPPPGPPADDIRWDVLKETSDVALLLRFIDEYPDSRHRAEAERRIASLAQQTPVQPQPNAMAPPAPAAAPAPPPADPADEHDWGSAQKADSYEAYRAYARRHPQGIHLADAIETAISHALLAEPGIGRLPTGETVMVDDGVCPKAEIKLITGGDVNKGISRTKKCVPRSNPF